MRDLTDRVVVVTGAGSGIGRATAEAFAAQGCRVHVVDIHPARVEEVVAALRGKGQQATGHVVDVRDAEAVEALAREVVAAEGRVDVVHNNAGVGLGKPFEETTLEDWEWIVSINLWGVVHGCRAFIPHMLAQGEGVVVNSASILGLMAGPGVSAYSTTKFAVVGLSESLDLEYKGRGIRVIAVCPGLIATNIVADGRVSLPNDRDGTRVVAGFARHGVDPAYVAADVVAAVRRPQPRVVTPRHARVIRAVHAMSPRLHRWLMNRVERNARGD